MSDELIQQAAALKVISDYTKDLYDDVRDEVAKVMKPGDRRQAESPEGMHIGTVSRSKPTPKAIITDRTALTAWLSERYPDMIESGTVVNASDREILDVVFKHAPHLLKHTKRVKTEALARLQADAIRLGVAVGPSGEVDMPGLTVEMREPVVSCLPDKDNGLLAVMEMVHNGRMYLDGTLPKEIEA